MRLSPPVETTIPCQCQFSKEKKRKNIFTFPSVPVSVFKGKKHFHFPVPVSDLKRRKLNTPVSLSQILAVPSTPDATWRDDWQQWWPVIECGRDNKRGILIATSIRFRRNVRRAGNNIWSKTLTSEWRDQILISVCLKKYWQSRACNALIGGEMFSFCETLNFPSKSCWFPTEIIASHSAGCQHSATIQKKKVPIPYQCQHKRITQFDQSCVFVVFWSWCQYC